MRLYNGKAVRNMIDRRVSRSAETRDAVVWDIDTVNQVCRVKIQGSDNLVIAHFPRNWKVTPYWCKTGNAVAIRHRTGVRGYVEVTGEGRAIPSPVSGAPLPNPQTLPDMVLTGCRLMETDPPSMSLLATSGTYRISGVVYQFNPLTLTGDAVIMDVAPIMIMDSAIVMNMDSLTYTVTLDAAPAAGYFRYDLFCIGADQVLDYHPGTPAKTNPVKPSLPSAHVMIGDYILVQGGATVIENGDIGRDWKLAQPTAFVTTFDSTFDWDTGDDTPECNITVQLVDQYGNPIVSSFSIRLTLAYGTGDLWSLDTGYGSPVTQAIASASSYTFKYRRDQTTTEHSPMISVVMVGSFVQTTCRIYLLDALGEIIY